jgi:uncharacterized repeat protein (TIGR01451 family)
VLGTTPVTGKSTQGISMPYQRLGWLTGGTLLLLGAMGSPVIAQTTIVDETFRNSSTFGWRVGNQSPGAKLDPCLTAGNATTPANSIQPCGDTVDPNGAGVLRLTTAQQDQATFAFYDFPIPSELGLEITFNYFSYGGAVVGNPPSNGDGVTFFLFDGNTPNAQAQPGAFGGSLGYAQKQDPGAIPGLVNGYLGVGLDEFGNFANDLEGRGTGSPVGGNCAGNPPAAADRVLDSITLRGSGNGQTGYCFLANSGLLPQGIDVPGAVNRNGAIRSVRIVLTPDEQLSVFIDFTGTQNFPAQPTIGPLNLRDTAIFPNQSQRPSTFKLGFAASTGGATNIHEIQNFKITTLQDAPTPDLAIKKTPNPASFVGGETAQYTLTVTNVGQGSTTGPVTVTDTLPEGFSLASFSGNGWNCLENPARTVTCVYSGDPLSNNPATDPVISPGETQEVVITVNVPTTPGDYTNSATVSTIGDNNPTNDNDQTTVPVTGIVVPSKTARVVDANNNGAADPDEAIVYTLTLSNVSTTDSPDTTLSDEIPPGTTYIPGTTTLNGAPVADAPGNIMPFSGNGAPVNSAGAPPGQIAAGQTATVEFQVRINNPPGVTEIRNIGRVNGPQIIPSVPTPPAVTPIGVVGVPRLRLVKRITQVNTTPNTSIIDDPADPNDNPGIWPANLQPIGFIRQDSQNPLKSGDEVEYTIYYLSDGTQNVQNVRLCDAIPEGTTFVPNSFGAGSGILVNQGGAQTPQTNAADTDKGTFILPLTPVTAPCPNTNNPNGSVLLQLGEVVNTPPNNVGFVRFRVKID